MRDTHTCDDRRIPEDGRRVREVIKQRHPCAEQHRCQIDLDRVEQPGVQALWIVSAPCTATDFGATAAFACATALSMPSVTKWTVELGRGQPSGIS